MSAPRVTQREGEDYHAARKRASDMNRAVADALGWRIATRTVRVSPEQAFRELEASRGMFGAPDYPTYPAGTHEERYWVRPDGKEDSETRFNVNENEALPDWQGELDKAWGLAVLMKEPAFLMEWLNLPPGEVAYRICEIFVETRRRGRTDEGSR